MKSSYRRKWAVTAAAISSGAMLLGLILVRQSLVRTARAEQEREEKYLFVWAGDQTRTNPDFLAVINFDKESSRYGRVITTVPLPGPGATGNEPHHVSLSADGKVLGAGGLLSVLKGQNEVFFFDVSHSRSPRFISSANPPLSSITDDFYPLTQGGFLVTMMGGPMGHAPGRVAEFDKNLQLVAEYPATPPDDGFNRLPRNYAAGHAGWRRFQGEHPGVESFAEDHPADHCTTRLRRKYRCKTDSR